MNLLDLTPFESVPYFTLEGVRQLTGQDGLPSGSLRTAVYRWMKAGRIIQLKRGMYMTRRYYEAHRSDVDFSAMISAVLLPQSYLSLEYVLQRGGIMSEITYPVTAITLQQTRTVENSLGTFTYRNIKPALFRGFSTSEVLGVPTSQASLAKALFDYLYLRHWFGSAKEGDPSLAEELRLNLEAFTWSDRNEFFGFIADSHSRKMMRILENLEGTIWRT